MSQVKKIKKFSGGGEVAQPNNDTPPKAKGKLIIGSKEYDADDALVSKFTSFAQSQTDVDQSVYRDILNGLSEGKTISYDPLTNELSGLDNISSLNDRQNKKINKERTGFGRLTAQFGGDSKTGMVRAAVNALKSFDGSPKEVAQVKAPLSSIDVSKKRAINYDKNDKGENVWLQTLENQDALNTLSNIQNAYNLHAANEGSVADNYDIKGFDFSTGYDLHSKNPDYLNDVIGRLQSGKLTSADREFMKSYNIHLNENTTASSKTAEEIASDKLKEESKANAISLGIDISENERAGDYIYKKDEKDNMLVYDKSGNPISKQIITENSPFWSKNSKYNKGVILNGRIYSLAQLNAPEYNSVASEFKKYKDAMLSGDIAKAEQYAVDSGIETWTNGDWINKGEDGKYRNNQVYKQGEIFLTDYEGFFGRPDFAGSNVWISNITGSANGLTPSQTLLRYFSHNQDRNRNQVDEWGRPKANYVMYDSATKTFNTNINMDSFGVKPRFNQESSSISMLNSSDDGLYWEDTPIVDSASDMTYRVVRSKQNVNEYYIQYNGEFHKITNLPEFLKKYKNNTKISRTDIDKYVNSEATPGKGKTLQDVIAPVQNYKFKTGGKVPIFAQGDKFSGVQQSAIDYNSNKKFEGTVADPTSSATMEDIGNLDLTSADWLQLGALGADVAALGTAAIGGGLAAGVIGAGASVTQFISDIKRDGMDKGDWGNLALSLGLDAVSLVPVAGVSGKAMKTIKLLKRSKNMLSTAFGTIGMYGAIDSLNNILDENKKMNADDIRGLFQGIQALVGAKRGVIDPFVARTRGTKARRLSDVNQKTGKVNEPAPKVSAVEQLKEASFVKLKETPEFATRFNAKSASDPDFATRFGKELTDNPEAAVKGLFGEEAIPENVTKLVKSVVSPSKVDRAIESGKQTYGNVKSYKNQLLSTKPTHDLWTFKEIDNMDIADWRKNYIKKTVAGRIGVNPEAYGHRNQYEYVRNSSGKKELVERPGTNYNYLQGTFGTEYVRWYNPFSWGNKNNSERNAYLRYTRASNTPITDQSRLLGMGSKTPSHKNGGILKANKGLQLSNMFGQNPLVAVGNAALKGVQAPSALDNATQSIIPNVNPLFDKYRASTKALPKIEGSFPNRTPVDIFSSQVSRGPQVAESQSIKGDELVKEKFDYNKVISPDGAMSLAGLIGSGLYNKRIHDVQDKALVDAMSVGLRSPAEVYDNFTTYGVDNAYRQKAIRENQYKPITSDSTMSHAIEAGMKMQGNQTELEGNMKVAELASNHDLKNSDLRRRYSEVRANTVNQNKQTWSQLNMARAENSASKLANDYQGMNNWLMEKRQNYKTKDAEQQSVKRQMLSANMSESLENRRLELLAPHLENATYTDEWNKLSESSKNSYKNNKATWLYATKPGLIRDQYGKDVTTANNSLLAKIFGIDSNDPKNQLDIKYKKRGGKLDRLNALSSNATDRIWINQNSEIARAGRMLNQNIMKLFLSATSNANKKI